MRVIEGKLTAAEMQQTIDSLAHVNVIDRVGIAYCALKQTLLDVDSEGGVDSAQPDKQRELELMIEAARAFVVAAEAWGGRAK